jgi:hypothetical protein
MGSDRLVVMNRMGIEQKILVFILQRNWSDHVSNRYQVLNYPSLAYLVRPPFSIAPTCYCLLIPDEIVRATWRRHTEIKGGGRPKSWACKEWRRARGCLGRSIQTR